MPKEKEDELEDGNTDDTDVLSPEEERKLAERDNYSSKEGLLPKFLGRLARSR